MGFQIAIDGPAGAGKSTIARQLASQTGFIYVDTGAMYRAMALFLWRSGIAPEDTDKISSVCREADISLRYERGEQIVVLDGENVNGLIRTEEVSNMTSLVSANPEVRRKLVELQQQLAASADVVMDGRDIGTCVLPDAQLKIFLTADSRVRAKRRFNELADRGVACDLDQIEQDIIRRDAQDMTREHSPLRQAEDAVLVNTSQMDIGQAVAAAIELYQQRSG